MSTVRRTCSVRDKLIFQVGRHHALAPREELHDLAAASAAGIEIADVGSEELNPAGSVREPKYSYREGKTPVLSREDARVLMDSFDTTKLIGLRDRALIGLMVYSSATIGAVTN